MEEEVFWSQNLKSDKKLDVSQQLYIYRHYIPGINVSKRQIKSPIRKVASGVQFNLYHTTTRSGPKVYWKDWGCDSPYGNDVYAFICEREKCGRERAVEVARSIVSGGVYIPKQGIKTESLTFPLVYETMDFLVEHISYYDTLYVSRFWLDRYEIKGLKSVVQGPTILFESHEEDFGFYWETSLGGKKAYMPFHYNFLGDRMSWFHKGIKVLEGWDQINWFADHLIVTKSMKDVLVLRSCGYNAVCVSSETSLKILLSVMGYLSLRFEIYVWSDPDRAGIAMVNKIKKHFNNVKVCVSRFGKDPSDILINLRSRFMIHEIFKKAS